MNFIYIFLWLALNGLTFYNWQIPYMVAVIMSIPPSLIIFPFAFIVNLFIGYASNSKRILEYTFFTVLFYVVLPILEFPYYIASTLINAWRRRNLNSNNSKIFV